MHVNLYARESKIVRASAMIKIFTHISNIQISSFKFNSKKSVEWFWIVYTPFNRPQNKEDY
jgi:hypothetical protein